MSTYVNESSFTEEGESTELGRFVEFKIPKSSLLLEEHIREAQSSWKQFGKAMVTLLRAPCGTGKTLFAPLRLCGNRRMIILIPRIMAVRNAVSFYMEKGTAVWSRSNKKVIKNAELNAAKLVILTEGSFSNFWKEHNEEFDPRNTMFMLDEAHEYTPEAHLCCVISRELGFNLVLSTATPVGALCIPGSKHETTGREYDIACSIGVLTQTISYNAAMKFNALNRGKIQIGEAQRILLVSGTLEDAKGMACLVPSTTYDVELSRNKMTMYKGPTIIEEHPNADSAVLNGWLDKHVEWDEQVTIISSPVVEVGVTINDLDIVIDSNARLVVDVVGRVFQGGTLQDPLVFYRFASTAEMVQVRGRVGRTKPGRFYTFDAGSNQEVVPLHDGQKAQTNLLLSEFGFGRGFDLQDPLPSVYTDLSARERQASALRGSQGATKDIMNLTRSNSELRTYLSAHNRSKHAYLTNEGTAPYEIMTGFQNLTPIAEYVDANEEFVGSLIQEDGPDSSDSVSSAGQVDHSQEEVQVDPRSLEVIERTNPLPGLELEMVMLPWYRRAWNLVKRVCSSIWNFMKECWAM